MTDTALSRVQSDALMNIEQARALLAAEKDLRKVKEIRDKAAAVQAYARAQKIGADAEAHASIVKKLAERRAGELLRATKLYGRDAKPPKSGKGLRSTTSGPQSEAVALKDLGVSQGESERWQKEAEIPQDLFDEAVAVAEKAKRPLRTKPLVKKVKAEKKKKAIAKAAKAVALDPARVELRHCDMEELLAEGSDFDAIITDPPYPEEFLPLYPALAKGAARSLRPGGILAVMCGQSYLPQILAGMSKYMQYRWTLAYLTPGGQAVQLWQRKVNTFWKPILLFGGTPEWTGDVVHSDTNDNDKRFHEWGQSVSGMVRLVEALTVPGARVVDPFMGAGTTGVACVATHRRFLGCDIDKAQVETARGRIAEAQSHDQ